MICFIGFFSQTPVPSQLGSDRICWYPSLLHPDIHHLRADDCGTILDESFCLQKRRGSLPINVFYIPSWQEVAAASKRRQHARKGERCPPYDMTNSRFCTVHAACAEPRPSPGSTHKARPGPMRTRSFYENAAFLMGIKHFTLEFDTLYKIFFFLNSIFSSENLMVPIRIPCFPTRMLYFRVVDN